MKAYAPRLEKAVRRAIDALRAAGESDIAHGKSKDCLPGWRNRMFERGEAKLYAAQYVEDALKAVRKS